MLLFVLCTNNNRALTNFDKFNRFRNAVTQYKNIRYEISLFFFLFCSMYPFNLIDDAF